jgi:two-component system cell cycle sensor histidine kinase/response regulator CckA
VSLEIQAAGNVPDVLADRGMVEQIILNLVVNARDAMPEGGPLLIANSAVEFSEADARRNPAVRVGRFACLSVTDRGCGIAPEIRPRLFEPFFTTKEVGKGTGLGLATVYGIVRQHEGWIEVESAPDQGTTFRIFLPESVKPIEEASPKAAPSAVMGGKETILLVEDEPALRDVAQIILEEQGYHVYLAGSGLDALKDWPHFAAEVDLLVTDMVMPGGVSGRELARRLQEQKPGLKVIHTSGYSLELSDADSVLEEGLNFLPKPYTGSRLAAIVRECLDRGLMAPALAA